MKHTDKMPFGKYKGIEMSKVPTAYRDWFCEQDWTEEKFPDIYEYFESGGQSAGPLNPSADVAQQQIDEETERNLFNSVDLNFTRWFLAAYGNTKKTHPGLYLPTFVSLSQRGLPAANPTLSQSSNTTKRNSIAKTVWSNRLLPHHPHPRKSNPPSTTSTILSTKTFPSNARPKQIPDSPLRRPPPRHHR